MCSSLKKKDSQCLKIASKNAHFHQIASEASLFHFLNDVINNAGFARYARKNETFSDSFQPEY